MESKKRTNLSRILIVSALFLMLSLCIVPASATDTFSNYKQIYVPVENDAGARFDIYNDDTYYFIFDRAGKGLNATHMSDDYTDPDGDVYTGKGTSGTFYITDTSTDVQYHDNAILMFAIPYSDYYNASNRMSLTVTSSGYSWTPTGDGDKPDQGDITYQSSAVSETFGYYDFLSDTSKWRPSSLSNYPVYHGQDMSGNEQFKFMFIDLYAGTLNESAYTPPLMFNGSVRVQYTISDYNGDAVFDAYAYNNQSNRGQGVSWTNRLSDTFGNSGWTVGF